MTQPTTPMGQSGTDLTNLLSSLLPLRPPPPIHFQQDRAEDWLQETTPDGRPCWRNVRSLELSWSEPVAWRTQGRPTAPAWQKQPRDDGLMEFVHLQTGERLQPRRGTTAVSEKRRKDLLLMGDTSRLASRTVDVTETALGRKIFDLSVADLERRSGHLGSTRSLMDREKYYREFRLVNREAGAEIIKLLPGGGQQTVATLTAEQAAIYRANPHIHQVFANGRPYVAVDRRLQPADRIAPPSLEPRMAYARRQGEVKTVEHWGQRKLLMSEIEFLTLYGDRASKVVYAGMDRRARETWPFVLAYFFPLLFASSLLLAATGAAPGDHINFLSATLFPELEWLLVDPAPFACKATDRIKLRQDYFTDELAASLRDEATLFICDVRSMDSGLQEEEKEGRVFVDMQWQQQWVKLMRPKAAMLKFRLPYPSKNSGETDSTTYMDGDIFLPVWGGRTTTETRLVVTDPVGFELGEERIDFFFLGGGGAAH